MVDIYKFLPSVSDPFSSNNHHFRGLGGEHLPAINGQRWFRQNPPNSPRFLDASTNPYSLHRKVMYQELSRPCMTSVRLNATKRRKESSGRHASKDTSVYMSEANISPAPSVITGDTHSSHGTCSTSKFFTLKGEGIRPANSFLKSSTTTSTSWQRYWASTHAQRRRMEANESQNNGNRLKYERSLVGQTHFVVLRDTPQPHIGHNNIDETISPDLSSYSTTQLSTVATVNQRSAVEQSNDVHEIKSEVTSFEPRESSFVPPSTRLNVQTMISEATNSIPPSAKTNLCENNPIEKSVFMSRPVSSSLSMCHFKSESLIIGEVADAQETVVSSVIEKTTNLSLQPVRIKSSKKTKGRRPRSRSKSPDKSIERSPSGHYYKRLPATNPSLTIRSLTASRLNTPATLSKSKSSARRWDDVYSGLRFDPPTPPCSPSLHVWPDDSDRDDNSILFQKSEIFDPNASIRLIKKP